MSADNGLHIRKEAAGQVRYVVLEYNASTGSEYELAKFGELEQAVLYADDFQRKNIVEYGISFDLGAESVKAKDS